MPRALCMGNGNFQVNIDNDMNIRDMFFPFVGLENHVSSHFCRFGVWVDERFSWVDASWNKKFSYKNDSYNNQFQQRNFTRLSFLQGTYFLKSLVQLEMMCHLIGKLIEMGFDYVTDMD